MHRCLNLTDTEQDLKVKDEREKRDGKRKNIFLRQRIELFSQSVLDHVESTRFRFLKIIFLHRS